MSDNSNTNANNSTNVDVSAPSTNPVDSTNLFAFNSSYSAFASPGSSGPGSVSVEGQPQPDSLVDLTQFGTQILLNMQAAASNGVDQAGNSLVSPGGGVSEGSIGSPGVHPSVPSLMQDFNPYFYLNNLNLNNLNSLPPQVGVGVQVPPELGGNGQGDLAAAAMNSPLSGPLNSALNQVGVMNMNYLGQSSRSQLGALNSINLNLNPMNPMGMNMNMVNMNPSICKFFAAGHCARGDQCNYAHIPMQPGAGPGQGGNGMGMGPGPMGMNPKPHRSNRGGRGGGPGGEHYSHYNHGGPGGRRDFQHSHPHGHQGYPGPGGPVGRGGRYNGGGRGPNSHRDGQPFGMNGPMQVGGSIGRPFPGLANGPPHQHPHLSHGPHSSHPHGPPHHSSHPHPHSQPPHSHAMQHPHSNIPPANNGAPNSQAQPTTHSPSGPVPQPGGSFEDPSSVSPFAPGFNSLINPGGPNKMPGAPGFGLGLGGLSDNSLGLPGFLNPGMPPNGPGGLNMNPNLALAGLDPAAAAAFMNLGDPNNYSAEAAAVQAAFFHAANNNLAAATASMGPEIGLAATADDLVGRVYSLAKDQYGCRLLQRLLDDGRPGVLEVVFTECFEHINDLMTDPFGNYLCQKLIEHCSDAQRLAILHRVAPDLVAISLNLHGTRAVQKLVETISTPPEVEILVNSLRTSVVTLIKDLNGNHVIQRALHHLSSKDNQFIYDAVCRYCVSVATHKHGCCVLQRCIDYANSTQKRQLVSEIIASSLELVQDAFGNYVVQYVLDLGEPNSSNQIIANLLGHISALSVQKFSSNVIEKCLELANDKMRGRVVDELVNVERLPRLLQDPYANYVIQKALAVSKKTHLDRLVQVIKPHLHALRNTSFGKRIQNKILKKFPDLDLGFGANGNGAMFEENGSAAGSTGPGSVAGPGGALGEGADASHLNEMEQLSDEIANQLQLNAQSPGGEYASTTGADSSSAQSDTASVSGSTGAGEIDLDAAAAAPQSEAPVGVSALNAS